MTNQGFEEWLLGTAAAAAVAITLGAQVLTTPIAASANAAEAAKPGYSLTVTAHRLPAACKTAATRNSAACSAFGEATETMRVN